MNADKFWGLETVIVLLTGLATFWSGDIAPLFAQSQGVYRGGSDDGYDSITLDESPTERPLLAPVQTFPTHVRPGERVQFTLREEARLMDANGKLVGVFPPGTSFVVPEGLTDGVFFFLYRGEGIRIWVNSPSKNY
jgi:hypothetical protein